MQALWDVTQQFQNKNGSILVGGKIYVYLQGRTALATTYHDEDGTVVNTNPIILDNNGRATCFASTLYSYTIVVCDYYGRELFSQDITLHDAVATAEKVFVIGSDGKVTVDTTTLSNGVQYDLSVNTDIIATKDYVDGELDSKKDKQDVVDAVGSATKTITRLQQDEDGKVSVTYSDIDLPTEVPNVEITSEDNSVIVTETTDAETNTKTFDLSLNNAANELDYGQFSAANVTSSVQLTKVKGNLELENYRIKLKKGKSYHFTVRGSYEATTLSNTLSTLNYIEYSTFSNIFINVDNSIADTQFFELSYDVYNLSSDTNYQIAFSSIVNASITQLTVEVHSIAATGSSSGGNEYTAGQGIDITSNEVSVDVGKGLGFDEDNKLEVKVGTGLTYDSEDNVVTIDNDVADVIETVEKLEEDLDTQLCVNFDLANITNVYDFADGGVTGLTNGATMLCQAFAVPINHAIRVHGEDNPTMLGIYFKNASYTTKFILALYVYDFVNGYTDYVGDTGPVQIYQQGLNQFALKTKNPNISELSSRCIYYASLYLPSTKNGGLYLAGCESYSSAGNINAIPRFTIGVENIALNNTEIDLDDSNATLSANDGQGNYYIGPWSDSYNERPSIPRFFMQIRNGEEPAIVTADPFTNIDYQSIIRNSNAVMSDVFDTSGLASATYPMVFQAVTPAVDVDIVSWTVYDGNADDSNSFYAKVYTSDFSDTVNTAATITDASGSYGYSHTVTPATPIHLTAGTTYRWPVCLGSNNYSAALRTYDSSVTTTKVLHLFASSWDISNWVTYSRVNDGPAVALTLVDSDNNTWHI